ncbi:hypothetical protein XTALMG727_0312 [Xanthomonas translucens pv. arrhenatheri LMG 727]|uniref:Uncharacterized protein n=1 Tax=Xanthomonas graminis pv. arrhenatheri LMG 727 TaxID=1195923 RepID=A0A0K2ZC64_9XANT|nr:hypothetical protein XTALMG727_0312 [Xanthomonas translucens pv. arrhenatheri LMG 727]
MAPARRHALSHRAQRARALLPPALENDALPGRSVIPPQLMAHGVGAAEVVAQPTDTV